MTIKKTFGRLLWPAILISSFFLWPIASHATGAYSEHELTFEKQGAALISPQILEKQAFNALAVHLDQPVNGLMVDFGRGWESVEIHDDGDGYDRLMFTAPTHTFQFLLKNPVSYDSLHLKVTVFYYDEAEFAAHPLSSLQASMGDAMKSYKVITRKEWSADEELRIKKPDVKPGASNGSYVDPCADIEKNYASEFKITKTIGYNEEGQPLAWPVQYADKIEKFVVHHTDSEIKDVNGDLTTDNRDYQAIIRAIYYYHAITRGWGDIGYNYVIDPLGNIYEGRFGGDKVIAAHAQCFNHGTMGIAIIGDYQNNDVPEPAMQALVWLLGQKAKQNKIDPQGISDFRGKKSLPNIIGHRDVRATACPGERLNVLLPKLRDRSALAMRTFSESTISAAEFDYNAEIVTTLSTFSLGPGERKYIELKFKNTGKKAWDDTTWLHVALNNNPSARLVPVVQDKAFVAGDLKETSVPPGKTGTFSIEMEGGYKPGYYSFQVSPVVNGRYKISRASEYLAFQVQSAIYDYEVVGHQFPSKTVFQGQQIQAIVELKNTGNAVWRNYGPTPISLGTSNPQDRISSFTKPNSSRLAYLKESEVRPGEVGHFILNLSVPDNRVGEVIEEFKPVIEKVQWLPDKALGFKVTIKQPKHLAHTTKRDALTSLYPGERRFVEVEMLNQGDLAWDASTVDTTLLGRGIKVFKRVLVSEESIKPGETMKLGFWVEAPLQAGRYTVNLRSRFNRKPIRGATAQYVVNVADPIIRAAKIQQSESLVTMAPNEEKELTVTFKNTGNTVWKKKGQNAVHLGTSTPIDRKSSLFYKAGWSSEFRPAELEEDEVLPGETGTFKFRIRPTTTGNFIENFQLVMEGVTWMPGTNVRWQAKVTKSGIASVTKNNQASVISSKPDAASPSTINSLPDSSNNPTAEKPFRVRISYESDTSTLTIDRPFLVFDENNEAIFNLSANKSVTVTRSGDSLQVQVGTTTKTVSIFRMASKEEGGVVEISSMERRPAWNPSLNDNAFRGLMEIRVIEGKAAYINELPLEDYLKGMAEVSNGDPAEKLKTIAVLARTYARFYMSDENRKFPGMPYDGSDDPNVFQRYLGYGVELRSPNFLKAVKDTQNMVVVYKGQLIKTPYFNQSDGQTRSAQEVWKWTNTPYLKVVPDPWCKGLELKGHGVGLSGYGATEQAKEGKTYEEIIKYYYTGVEVKKLD